MTIYMEGYREPRVVKLVTRREKELSRAHWNPAFRMADLARFRTPQEPGPRLPNDFSTVDMRAFVERVRALATQI
jgi:hypothetical protein